MASRMAPRSPSSSSTSMWMRQKLSGSNQAKARAQPHPPSSTISAITPQRFMPAALELHQRAHDPVVGVVALVLVIEAGGAPLAELDGVAGLVDEDGDRPDEPVLRTHVDAGAPPAILAVPEAAAAEAATGGIGIDRADVRADIPIV